MMKQALERWGRRALDFLRRSGSLLVVLVLWELLVRAGVLDYRFFPAPTSVLETLFRLTVSGEMPADILVSLQRVLMGFALGTGLGLVLGLATGWSKVVETIVEPLIAVFYPIPKLALLPLILILFGIGETSKVAIVAIAVFFTVVISTAAAVRGIEPVLLDAAHNYGARGWRLFTRIILPAAMPEIFTGVRLGMGISLIVIVAAEFVASNQGLGHRIWLSWGTLSTRDMYAGLVVIGLIGLLSTYALNWVGRRLMPWYVPEARGVSRARLNEKRPAFHPLRFLRWLAGGVVEVSRLYMYALPNDVTPPPPGEMPEGMRLVWIDESNVAEICSWKGSQWQHLFRRNLNRGMIGLYALLGGRVIGYMWATIETPSNAIFCAHYPTEMGDGFIKTAEVMPEYRRQGVASWLRYAMIQRIRELGEQVGLRRICGTVLVQNTPMLKLVERQGSRRVQEFVLVRLTPYVFIRWIWAWDPVRRARLGRGRLSVRFKIPKFLSDPRMQRLLHVRVLKSERAWQPKGEA